MTDNLRNHFSGFTEEKVFTASAQNIIVALILLITVIVRLLLINAPSIDRTAWKEIDYITISVNYGQHGYNFFNPEISWPAEEPRVTAMEFPLVPYMTSFIYVFFGFNALSVRFITLLSAVLLVLYTYKLTRIELGPVVAIAAAAFVAVFPLNHPFNKYLFTEPALIFFTVFTIYYTDLWLSTEKRKHYFLAAAGLSLTIALKITELYILIPLCWLAYRKYRFNIKQYKYFILLIIVSLILPAAWYSYAYYLTLNSIDVFGIFKGHNKFQTITMLSGMEWYKIMYNRITVDILGTLPGAFFFVSGFIIAVVHRKGGLFFAYISAIILFFVIVAEGNIDAPYRQLTIIPSVSVFAAIGLVMIIDFFNKFVIRLFNLKYSLLPRFNIILIVFIVLASMLSVNIHNIFLNKYKPIHTTKWELAQKIKQYNMNEKKLITAGEYSVHVGGYDLSPVIYYYANVRGWTLLKDEWSVAHVDMLRHKGANLFVAYQMNREPESLGFINKMKAAYKIIYEDKEKFLLLLDLEQPLYASK